MYTTAQSQKAVTAYFSSKQLLPFDFTEQNRAKERGDVRGCEISEKCIETQ